MSKDDCAAIAYAVLKNDDIDELKQRLLALDDRIGVLFEEFERDEACAPIAERVAGPWTSRARLLSGGEVVGY